MSCLQARVLSQGKRANVNGMDGEICLAPDCENPAPVLDGPAVAHVKSAEYGIPMHSSSLHRNMSPQEHTAAPVLPDG